MHIKFISHNYIISAPQELGVRIDFFSWECYRSNAFYWLIVYVILQVIGFILAVRTRNVKIKALNDSKCGSSDLCDQYCANCDICTFQISQCSLQWSSDAGDCSFSVLDVRAKGESNNVATYE